MTVLTSYMKPKETVIQGFSILARWRFFDLDNVLLWVHPVYCRMLSSIPTLHPLDASRTQSPSWDNQNCPQMLPNVSWGTISPAPCLKIHCFKQMMTAIQVRTSELGAGPSLPDSIRLLSKCCLSDLRAVLLMCSPFQHYPGTRKKYKFSDSTPRLLELEILGIGVRNQSFTNSPGDLMLTEV